MHHSEAQRERNREIEQPINELYTEARAYPRELLQVHCRHKTKRLRSCRYVSTQFTLSGRSSSLTLRKSEDPHYISCTVGQRLAH